MNKTNYFFKDSKSYSEDSNLQSLVIDWLRFPLAIAVVFRIWQYLTDNGGLHMFWDSSVWGLNIQNWLGWATPMTGPILVPLWFVRDLMVIVLLTPIIYNLIKRLNFIPIILLGLCYISGIWIQIPGFTITTFFWFSLGAYFGIKGKNMIASIYKWRFPSYIVCICTLFPLIWLNDRKGDGITVNIIGQTLYPFYVIASSFSIISIGTTLIQKGKVKVYPHLAKVSFFVFLSHVFVLGYISNIINKCLPIDYGLTMIAKYLITPIATVVVCLLIYSFLDKFLPRFLAFITGSRK